MLDLDGTLIDGNVILEAYIDLVGGEKAMQLYKFLRTQVKNKKMTKDQILAETFEEFAKKGLNKKNYENAVKKIIKEGKVRKDVLKAVEYAKKHGTKVVLVTKSSEYAANLFAKSFGLDGAIGTREYFGKNGQVIAIKNIIGDRTSKKFITKMDLLKEWCKKRGVPFSKKKVILFTDSVDDRAAMKKAGITVLYRPKQMEHHQKSATKRGLINRNILEIGEKEPNRVRQMKIAVKMPKAVKTAYKRVKQSGLPRRK